MIEIKEFRASWGYLVVCVIVALALLIILSGIMTKLADWRIRQRDMTIQELQRKIALGQQVIIQIAFPESTAKALEQAGWQVKDQPQRTKMTKD